MAATRVRAARARKPSAAKVRPSVASILTGMTGVPAYWGRHNVRIHRTARKRLHNPVVGDIELTGDALELPGEGLTLAPVAGRKPLADLRRRQSQLVSDGTYRHLYRGIGSL
jgi:MmyB-like transcription regulator ligand binding domain